MAKEKIIYDKKKSDQKKALRIPMPKRGGPMDTDKKKYSRKSKYRKDWKNGTSNGD